jgi:uncharacterized protein (DUF1015 family)
MRTRYLSLSPHNLVRVILGESSENDTDADNVYTRAGAHFKQWIDSGILLKDKIPVFYAYFQQFTVPDTGESLTRKGFIGLGKVEDYSAGVVHRHEQTLTGPKKDRRQVLEHTRAHFGQIFMLYPDSDCAVDALLDEASKLAPLATVRDEYDTIHTLYRIEDTDRIQQLMSDKKLLIADGHHRYETALAFKNDHPDLKDAQYVMMTFVNMYSPGLRILATHRVLTDLPHFNSDGFFKKAAEEFQVLQLDTPSALKQLLEQPAQEKIRIGVALRGADRIYLLERARNGQLDVPVLHQELIEGALGVTAEQVRDEKFIKYVRGLENATTMVANGAQIGFLLEATTVQQVADASFSGGVMPQKSTDFYPKLLTGLTIYKLEK